MDAETIRFNVTLKTNEKVYLKGEILNAPFSSSITSELRHNTGTITVLKRKQTDDAPKPVTNIPDPVVFEIPKVNPFPDIKPVPKRRGRKPKK